MNLISLVVGAALLSVGGAVFLGFLLSYPVMLLWNGCLVPAVPALAKIGWLQAWGIVVLCSILFKSATTSKESKN